MTDIATILNTVETDLIALAQDLVRIKSYTGQEEEIIRFITKKMEALGYDEVRIDAMGNVLGRMGSKGKSLLFDSHIDTVNVTDEKAWDHPPFGADIVDGRLYGRGSVDMKSAAAASIYAGFIARELGLTKDRTVYVSCSVLEEDCDGENLKHLFEETGVKPDYVMICEPSANKLVTGHKGKAQMAVTTHGVSAHGSAPEKGENAIYEMAEIIQRIEQTSLDLLADKTKNGTLVASQITSKSESLNAVPFECEVYLDRRLDVGETKAEVEAEMEKIISGKNASWKIGTLTRKSWTGKEVIYDPFHAPWQIEMDHDLTQACLKAHNQAFGRDPEMDFWDFSTNAVTTTELGIPTIGFGPGEYKLAHMVNENCEVSQIVDACRFYAALIGMV